MEKKETVAITSASVLQTINAPQNKRRIIWTPTVVLETLRIGYYPYYPKKFLASAKRALATLCTYGELVQRDELHERYGMREKAYMRPQDAATRINNTKRRCYGRDEAD